MTDLTFPPSARRFASLLDRGYCVWMPSPSVAVLSALVTGKGRPRRLLVPENAPAFISNIGRVAGAMSMNVPPHDIDGVLHGLLRTEGLSPEHVWGVATHRDGRLSPTDWLSRCAASGVPTIELCLGSFTALARWGPSPATFTIVDLDAEEAFAGAHLTALLTSDRGLAARVQELCLPGPEARDYIFDAWPRGLAHDEPALMSMVEDATGPGGEKTQATGAMPALTLPWARRFRSVESLAEVEKDRWSTRLAEAEARHTEAVRAAVADASSLQSRLEQQLSLADEWQRRLRTKERDAASQAERDSLAFSESQKKLDQQQRTIDQWEARFHEAESEASEDAAILSNVRADLLRHRSESERALVSMQAEREALAQKLLRTERERDLAVADAARRDESERTTLGQLRLRVEQFEKAAAVSAEREARQAEAVEASRALLSARVVRLEADAVVVGKARADLLKQKTEADQALAAIQVEKQALTRKLSDLDAELGEALADAARRTAAQRVAIDEQTQRAARLEREVATLTSREATQAREWEASRTELSERIAGLKADASEAGPSRAVLLAQKAEKERTLAAVVTESEALGNKLSAVEKDRDRALADAADREKAQRSALDGQRRRAELSEAEAVALKERETRLTEEWSTARAGLTEQLSRMEAEAVQAQGALSGIRAEKDDAERALAQARAEGAAASEKLAEAERGRAQALADAGKGQESLHRALDEERQRGNRLEKEAAVLTLTSTTQVREWEALRVALSERIARLEADSALAEKARGELLAQKEESDRGRALLQSEKDTALLSSAEAVQAHDWEVERTRMSARMVRLEATAAEAEKAHTDLASQKAAEAARREEAQRAALEGQRQRADRLEADAVARTGRETRLTDEWALRQAELSERIVRLEAAVVVAEKARTDLVAQKAEGDRALAGAAERETKLSREWEAARSEWSARIRQLEAAAAATEKAQADLLAQKNDAGRALASVGAERETLAKKVAEIERDRDLAQAEAARREQTDRAELEKRLKTEAATSAKREAAQAEAWEASRVELATRIARLEAAEVIADKARTELLNRKRETDQALAAAQSERVALLKKLASAEHDRDQAQVAPARHGLTASATSSEAPPSRVERKAPDPSRNTGGQRITGGLSALVSLWNTAVIGRPSRRKETGEKPPDPPVQAEPVALSQALATAEPERGPAQAEAVRNEAGQAERVAGAAPAPPENERVRPKPAAPPRDSGDSVATRNTGGLSALVSLWNTAATMRPFRRKMAEEKPPDPPVNEPFEYEGTAKEPSSSGTAPTQEGEGQRKPDRPSQGGPPRPNPPRRPEPKPAPTPDKTKESGGWLRGLASRFRGKP